MSPTIFPAHFPHDTPPPARPTMHSYRLRYVALGLLIYIQSTFSSEAVLCRGGGGPAGLPSLLDVSSRTVGALVVIEARAVALLGAPSSPGEGTYNVTFRMKRLLKGTLGDLSMGEGRKERKRKPQEMLGDLKSEVAVKLGEDLAAGGVLLTTSGNFSSDLVKINGSSNAYSRQLSKKD